MDDLFDFYQVQAQENRSTIPWLAALQEEALAQFSQMGFPTRHDEDWKYTTVTPLLQQPFTRPTSVTDLVLGNDYDLSGYSISIVNGQVVLPENLPSQVIIQPLMIACKEHTTLIRSYFNRLKQEHAFQALNLALLHTGLFIYIPENIQLDAPIIITHWQDHPYQAVYGRHLIVAAPKSDVSVVEIFEGPANVPYFSSTISELFLETEAHIQHYKIQKESKAAFHIGHVAVEQGYKSQFSSHSLSLGGRLVRSDISCQLKEEYAQCVLNGIYNPNEGQHVDHHTAIYHVVPNCQSEQDYKGILSGVSSAVFNGKVIVEKGAQHTQAQQHNKNLLLSDQAEVNTKPQLEIFADDVICGHGATVGQLDQNALFYMATRGIDPVLARCYLVQAFTEENKTLIPDPALAACFNCFLNEQLRKII